MKDKHERLLSLNYEVATELTTTLSFPMYSFLIFQYLYSKYQDFVGISLRVSDSIGLNSSS
jgi:hypothetical protein